MQRIARAGFTDLAMVLLAASLAVAGADASADKTPGGVASGSIAALIERAADGATVRLEPGVYRETAVIRRGVTLDGGAGAVIDPTEPFAPKWVPVDDVGANVWRCPSDETPQSLVIDGKILAALRDDRVQKPGDWHWRRLLASGTPLSGFRHIRGIWLWRRSEKCIYVHLGDGSAPASHRWSVLWRREPALLLAADDARVSGVTFSGAFCAVEIGEGARRCAVDNCSVRSYENTGIRITGGASDCRVVSNEVTRGSYESWVPSALGGREAKEEYEVWQVHKLAGHYDRVGINAFRAGSGNAILSNYVHQTFDGIDVGDYAVEKMSIPLAHPEDGQGTEIAWNVIEDVRDSGIELGAGAIGVCIHHNRLTRTHGGLRFKLPRIGPVFIHHNVLEDDRGFNFWFSMDSSPAEGYVYHNTVVGRSAALAYSSLVGGADLSGTPRWHFLNNLFVCTKGFFRDHTKGALAPNFVSSHNVIVGGGNPWPGDPSKDATSRYVDAVEFDAGLRPRAGGPAVGAGLDLSTYRGGRPLPGCEPGYFTGKAPDAGAFGAR